MVYAEPVGHSFTWIIWVIVILIVLVVLIHFLFRLLFMAPLITEEHNLSIIYTTQQQLLSSL